MEETYKLSFEDTKRLLDHACSAGPKMTAARVADFLEVPASRISEGRSQGWKLNNKQADLLISEYGQPKGRPGRFITAEKRNSLEEFLDNENELSKFRHSSRVLSYFYSKEFRDELADKISHVDESNWREDPDLIFSGDENLNFYEIDDLRRERAKKKYTSKEFRKFKLDLLFSVMDSERFSVWLYNTELFLEKLKAEHSDHNKIYRKIRAVSFYAIDDIPKMHLNDDNEGLSTEGSLDILCEASGIKLYPLSAMSIFLIGSIYRYSLKKGDATFSSKESGSMASLVENREYVITGKSIWKKSDYFSEPLVGENGIESKFFTVSMIEEGATFPILGTGDWIGGRYKSNWGKLSLDRWTTYEVSLFLKENCNYAMVLSLGSYDGDYRGEVIHNPERTIVFPNIPGYEIFTEIEKIRNWLGLSELPLNDMKIKIAGSGGYIPGAIVI